MKRIFIAAIAAAALTQAANAGITFGTTGLLSATFDSIGSAKKQKATVEASSSAVVRRAPTASEKTTKASSKSNRTIDRRITTR